MARFVLARQHVISRSFGMWLASSLVLGVVTLALMTFLAFEEPNEALLTLSSALVVAVPAGLLVHLSLTRGLTRAEKRMWIRELTGPRVASALSDYITATDRRATLLRRIECVRDASARI
jgi:hypothetical protein